ncbi:MAG: autotransporter-associated beta strand repeat-containing protein, partial [Verrucomicrobiota bacterium]
MKILRYPVLILALCLFTSLEALAVNRNWVGGASTNTWSQAANWSPAGVPANGDDLTFGLSSGVPTVNDLVGLRLDHLSVGHGDTLSGNSIVLSNGILCTAIGLNVNRINLAIELAASQSFECGEGNLSLEGEINLNGRVLTLDPFDNLLLPGVTIIDVMAGITGTGTIIIEPSNDAGRVRFQSLVNIDGSVVVYGELNLRRSGAPSISGLLDVYGLVTIEFGNQFLTSDSVVNVKSGGELMAYSSTENLIPRLILEGGSLVTINDNGGINPGLIWTTNLTVLATNTTAQIVGAGNFGFTNSTPVTIYGGPAAATSELLISARISTGGFEKFGPGRMRLTGTNTFSGSVIVSEGIVEAANATALGNTTGSTFLTGGELRLANALIGGESLYAVGNAGSTSRLYAPNGTVNSWAGSVFLNAPLEVVMQGSASVDFTGVIQDTATLIKSGSGSMRMSGTAVNTYSGQTAVWDGTLELQRTVGNAINGPLLISTGTNSLTPATVRLFTSTVIGDVAVTINRYGLLDLSGYVDGVGSLTLAGGEVDSGPGTFSFGGNPTILASPAASQINGNLDLGVLTKTFDIPTNAVLAIGANMTANSGVGIQKNGVGALALSGNNTYNGLTVVNAGRVSLGNANALGSTAVGTMLNGGTLDLAKLTYPAERLTNNSAASVLAFGPYATPGGAVWVGGITLNAELEIYVDEITGVDPLIAPLTISSVIDGSFGLRKTGDGRLILSGGFDNVFTGTAYVNEGTVELGKTGGLITIPRDLVIGTGPFGNPATVRYLAGVNNTVGAGFPAETGNITVNGGGLLDLNGQIEGFDSPIAGSSFPLQLYDGGDVQTGSGLLNLPASTGVYVNPGLNGSSTFSGRIGLASGAHTFNVQPRVAFSATPEFTVSATLEAVTGTATLTKTGNGQLRLTGNNTFTGTGTGTAGRLTLANANALGAAGPGVNVNNGASLAIDGSLNIDGEPLVLNTTNSPALAVLAGNSTWDSTVTLNKDASIDVAAGTSLRILNAIGGNFALTKSGAGTLAFGGSIVNTYTNATIVNAGTLVLSNAAAANATILGPLVIGDGSGGSNADVVRLGRHRQIANPVAVTISTSGLLDLGGYSDAIGSLAGSGNVVMVGPADFETGSDNTSTTFDGSMSGSANFWKHSTGTQTLNGTNIYTGLTLVEGAGKLLVNGAQPQSPVIISNSATLGGSGIVGHITADSSATVAPGSSAGILTSSNVTFAAGSTFQVELNGPAAGTGYDQLNVRGSATLGNAMLAATLGFAPTAGVPLTILNNDGADAITGTFNGLPNNSFLTIGGLLFQIRYNGGTGNDVTLTPTNTISLASLTVAGGNGSGFIDPNECNTINVVLTNANPVTTSNIVAKLVSETPGVVITQPFSSYPNLPANSTRTNLSPFQISTAPEFACGTPITLRLEVQSTNQPSFAVPVTLAATGSPGAAARVDNNTAGAIPGVGQITRTFAVSGVSSAIARVEVSLHITHTRSRDLDITLISPDGTQVLLASNNGSGSDTNYGISCPDGSRTYFNDGAATSINSAPAPYVGSFRPEQPLTSFIGMSGTNVNGTWTLLIEDVSGGGMSGTFQCASLFVYPVECAPGGGLCELCPNTTLTGALGAGSLQHSNRIVLDGITSTCGVPKSSPIILSGPSIGLRSYAAHVFQNGPAAVSVA